MSEPRDGWKRSEDLPEKSDIHRLHSPILRERREPRDGYEPVPLWIIAIFGALLFWGGYYLSEYGGGWRPDVLDPRPGARFAGAAPKGPVDPVELGRRLFTAHCVSCHQQSGLGVPGQYPPLAGSPWVLGPPQRLKRILLHGLEGPVTVLGKEFNGNMPAVGQRLDDEKLAAVLTYVRQAWGNDAAPVSPESVAATREKTKRRTTPFTAPELEKLATPDFEPAPEEPPGK